MAGRGDDPVDVVPPAGHRWQPIEDLPQDWAQVASSELRALAAVWDEQRESLTGDALRRFSERLQRQWAIETGIIERIYTLDRGVTEILIERGIDASLIPSGATDQDPEVVAQIIRDHEEAVDWIFDIVRRRRPMSTSFVKELHALLTRHQDTASGQDQFGRRLDLPLRHGDWKLLPNNPTRPDGPVHEYCPPEQVGPEMDRLVELHAGHLALGVPPEVDAAWLHHRFTQIHPFQDGNGRVARALASLVYVRAGLFPLVVTRDDREGYIGALEDADAGDLGGLVASFAALQRRALVDAMLIAREVTGERQRVDQVIASITDTLATRAGDRRVEWERAKKLADQLRARALSRFSQVAEQLLVQVASSYADLKAFADDDQGDEERSHWFLIQNFDAARKRRHFANAREYGAWVRLGLRDDARSDIVLTLTAVGRPYRGLIGAEVTFSRREQDIEGDHPPVRTETASEELFQLNYKDDDRELGERFDRWLERSLVVALELWRQGLPG